MNEKLPNFHTDEWNKIFRNLLADIKSQQCVLLIGPEIVKANGRPVSHTLREDLLRTYAGDIAHYYARDGFFLFRDKVAKEDIQREVKFFYEGHAARQSVETAIFKQIAEMPFHLVLSINPDSYLSDICFKHGIKHRFNYFQTNGGAIAEVEEPSKAVPLFYNLCGHYLYDESLILDYDDLFRLMKAVFGAPGLPTKLKSSLESAKTFVCLGFDFDKWYSQLLLRLLSEKKGSGIKKYAINTDIADADTTTFLVHQFGITFLGEDHAFFQELYLRCKQEGGLRALSSPTSPKAAPVIQQIKNGQIGQALVQLDGLITDDDEMKNISLMLSAQFNDLEGKRRHGTIDMRDYFVRFNQITDSLLDTLDKIA